MKKEFKFRMRRFLAVTALATVTLGGIGAYWQSAEKASTQENKKYELVETDFKSENGKKLYRIKALKNFGEDIKKGDLGGYVESEKNLSQNGDCWIFDNATVKDNSIVKDNAIVGDYARIEGNSVVEKEAIIDGDSQVKDAIVRKSDELYTFKNNYSKIAKNVTYQASNGLYNVNGILYSEENYLAMMKNENNKASQVAIANVGMVDALNDIAIE